MDDIGKMGLFRGVMSGYVGTMSGMVAGSTLVS